VIVALIFHIIFTVMALCYLSRQLRSHGLAILALAKALTLVAEAKKRLEDQQKWN
jgi:hypothetical protein